MRRFLTFPLVLILFLSLVPTAFADRPSVREESGNVRLRWKAGPIPVALSTSLLKGSANVQPDADVLGAVQRSLTTWENAAGVKFALTISDAQSVSPSGVSGDGVSLITIAPNSENVSMFGNDFNDASARTRVFFNGSSEITEADIVLSPFQQFSTDGTYGSFDLESTIVHEIGHLLGLEHSRTLGSTMHAAHVRNGVFSLSSFTPRSLTAGDVASVRALYGPSDLEDPNCCGSISGRLAVATGKPAAGYQIWAESAATGQVVAETRTGPTGSFVLSALPAGEYDVYFEGDGVEKQFASSGLIGRAAVSAEQEKILKRHLVGGKRDLNVAYAGLNGQLAELAVSVNPDRTFRIYIGGDGLDAKKVRIGSTSSFVTVDASSVRAHDYGPSLSVLSFDVVMAASTPTGEYTLFVESDSGARSYLVGALTVDRYENPWGTFSRSN